MYVYTVYRSVDMDMFHYSYTSSIPLDILEQKKTITTNIQNLKEVSYEFNISYM